MTDPTLLAGLDRGRDQPYPGGARRSDPDAAWRSDGAWRPALVALDIDGTILDHDQQLAEPVRQAVAELAASPVHVVIATGRSREATLPVLRRLGLDDGWVVCSNGSVVIEMGPDLPGGYQVRNVRTFDPGPALRLLHQQLPDALYAVETPEGDFLLTAPFPTGELEESGWVVPFAELQEHPACRVIVRSPDRTSTDFMSIAAGLGLHGVNYAVGWTAWLDLAPAGVSKASALELIRHQLDVPRDATGAVGDGRNDLEMFDWAGWAVAMGNASHDVRARADEVAPHVADHGLATVLTRWLT